MAKLAVLGYSPPKEKRNVSPYSRRNVPGHFQVSHSSEPIAKSMRGRNADRRCIALDLASLAVQAWCNAQAAQPWCLPKLSVLRGNENMKHFVVLVLVLVVLLAVPANAQTFRGSISGVVTDPSGAAVPNAAVKATESATSIDHTTITTSEGSFAFQDIPTGFYKV